MTFHLFQQFGDGRIVLAPQPDGFVLQTVIADDWQQARQLVSEAGLAHKPGHGWFMEAK